MEQPIAVGAQFPETETQTVANERTLRWFFVSMASVLLVIVAVGFAPSFYMPGVLRPDEAAAGKLSFPFYIVLHGIVLSLWYLLLFTQALLVARNRVALHQKLGIAGAVLAAILVPLGLVVVTRSVARSNLGAQPVLGDYALLTLFAIMVGLAIRHRGTPEVHKRLMLMASISIVAPALARWPGAEALVPISVIGPQLALFLAIMGHDLVTRRRVHRVTGWGTLAYFVAVGVTVPLASSDLGLRLVDSLK